MKQTLGVIGFGSMGRGIAKNIANVQYNILAWDTNETASEPFAADARVCTPLEMAAAANAFIFVVPGSERIESMLSDILSAAKPGLILWDFTTSDPTYTKCLRR